MKKSNIYIYHRKILKIKLLGNKISQKLFHLKLIHWKNFFGDNIRNDSPGKIFQQIAAILKKIQFFKYNKYNPIFKELT